MFDTKITNIRLNSRDELSLKITVKAQDYSNQELQLLKNSEINGDLLDINFVWLTKWDTLKLRKDKLVKLNWLMLSYCEKARCTLEEEKSKLYTRNKVNSRSDLSDSALDIEIDLYLNGLQYE